jgi:hypothetical protein
MKTITVQDNTAKLIDCIKKLDNCTDDIYNVLCLLYGENSAGRLMDEYNDKVIEAHNFLMDIFQSVFEEDMATTN